MKNQYKATFKAYSIDSKFSEAINRYKKSVGQRPTVAIAPPGYDFGDTEIHCQHTVEVSLLYLAHENVTWNEAIHNRLDIEPSIIPTNFEIEKPKQINRQKYEPICPHCKNYIDNWEALGWYWNWDKSDPPYWDALRYYVFKRDSFTCQNCGNKLAIIRLNAHHIIPKEHGGLDSADNLMTLCVGCHNAVHDYYDTLLERGLIGKGTKYLPLG